MKGRANRRDIPGKYVRIVPTALWIKRSSVTIVFGQLITQPRCMPKAELPYTIIGLKSFASLPLAENSNFEPPRREGREEG